MTTPAKPLTADEVADLKAKAKAATPGPWKLQKKHNGVIWHWYIVKDGAQIAEVSSWNLERDKALRNEATANADLLIAANPETIQRAIATIEQQAEQIEKLQADKREIENAAYERLELIALRRRDEWAKSGSERLLEGRRDGAIICGARSEEADYLAQQARALIQPPAQTKV